MFTKWVMSKLWKFIPSFPTYFLACFKRSLSHKFDCLIVFPECFENIVYLGTLVTFAGDNARDYYLVCGRLETACQLDSRSGKYFKSKNFREVKDS